MNRSKSIKPNRNFNLYEIMPTKSIASLNLPVLGIGNCTNTWPALFIHEANVLHALNIDWNIFSLLLGGLFAVGEC
jgi:hypothetical protein